MHAFFTEQLNVIKYDFQHHADGYSNFHGGTRNEMFSV